MRFLWSKTAFQDAIKCDFHTSILEDKIIYKVFAGPYKEEKIAKLSAEKLLELGFNTIYKKE